MKKVAVLFLVVFVALSCDTNKIKGHKEYSFYENSTIELTDDGFYSNASIEQGSNLVFKYFFEHEHQENIADDEYSERIIFEIPADMESFSYSDAELFTINAFFDEYCFCGLIGSIRILDGTISGSKMSDSSWNINIAVSFENNSNTVIKGIQGTFTIKN